MTPPAPAPRISALDALGGIAVIGLAVTSALAFALPGPAHHNPLAYGNVGPADYWVWLAHFVFIADKCRMLLAMLLGAWCLILLERGGAAPWRAHYARMIVLFAFGIVHALFLADNDVLRGLALAGMALPLIAGLSATGLLSVALGLLCLHFAFGLSALGAPLVLFHMEQWGADSLMWAERHFGSDGATIAMLLEQGREGLGERVIRRLAGLAGQLPGLIATLPFDLAGIALGMGLWKGGMLKGEWRTFRLQRVAGIAALTGLPGLLLLAVWLVAEGFPAAIVGPVALVFSSPFDMALAVGYAALAMAFLGRDTGLARLLGAAGQLALTNYLLTSVILASIFAPWGLGLFGEVTRWQAAAIGLVPVAGMLAFSRLWPARFGEGPFERAWRALARLLARGLSYSRRG